MSIWQQPVQQVLVISLILASGGIVSAFFNSRIRGRIFAVIAGLSGLYVTGLMLGGLRGHTFEYSLGMMDFMLDNVGRFFIATVGLGIFFCALYNASLSGSSRAYEQKNRFYYGVLGIFAASMLQVMLVKIDGTLNSALLFMAAWEIMSLFSFLLIVCSDEAKGVSRKALTYLLVMHVSAAFLMLGFISISLSPFGGSFFGFLALLIGFGIKLGLFPTHFYMADSYESAPGASAGLISGVMINMAIYGILRTFLVCVSFAGIFGYILLAAGVVSALWGVFRALAENRAKRVLAGSSMENMGLVIIGVGVFVLGEYVYQANFAAHLALAGVFIHSLNHSLFKSQLFYAVDLIRNWSGTTDLDKLGGQGMNFPGLKKSTMLGVLGISSLPPMNGFVGKFLLYASFFELMFSVESFKVAFICIFCLVVLGTVGALSLFVFVKFYTMIFLGALREKLSFQKKNPESSLNNTVLCAMSLLSLTLGVFPIVFAYSRGKFTEILFELSVNAFLIIGFSLLVWAFRHILTAMNGSKRVPTWGCGYSNITSKMEYTADSLSLPLMRLLNTLFPRKENNESVSELYPADIERHYEFRNPIGEGVDYVCKQINKLLSKLQFLQSGMMQSYLWISVLFLVLAIVYAIFSSSGTEVVK
ncbi:MAG: hypothetical protein IKB71_09915 [Lentisphaeria bacterium]|nr:hypothetical protein [Lentisphaeria bacterium]